MFLFLLLLISIPFWGFAEDCLKLTMVTHSWLQSDSDDEEQPMRLLNHLISEVKVKNQSSHLHLCILVTFNNIFLFLFTFFVTSPNLFCCLVYSDCVNVVMNDVYDKRFFLLIIGVQVPWVTHHSWQTSLIERKKCKNTKYILVSTKIYWKMREVRYQHYFVYLYIII